LGDNRVGFCGLSGDNYLHCRQPEGYLNYSSMRVLLDRVRIGEVVDATPVMSRARYVKGEEEIDRLQRSVRITELASDRLEAALQPGSPQGRAYALASLAILEELAEPLLGWCPGRWGEKRPRLASPPPGMVEAGLYLSVEIMAVVGGYFSQIAEAYVVGDPEKEALDIFEINRAAFDAMCAALRPGNTWGEAERETQAVAAGTGYKIDFLMHGRGSGHDGPLLVPVETHDRVRDDVIEEGTCFVIKPNAFPAEQEVAESRSRDVTFGDTVVVRAHAAERLGTRPNRLRVVP
jgi:Xaa-Pro aminopeptidase